MEKTTKLYIPFLLLFFGFAQDCFALGKNISSKKGQSLPATLKADQVFGDQKNNTIDAIGNVELNKDGNVIYSDKMTYDRNNHIIKAFGNVKIVNFQTGNVIAEYADVGDDLVVGNFDNAKIIFNDGSYLTSPKISRTNKTTTILNRSIFSICPNEDIAKDNNLAGKETDAISIKTSKTTIDKGDEKIRLNHAILRFYNVPIGYTPYLSLPMPSSKRKSGFLAPSYTKSTQMGLGFIIPYYFNIAPNKDLTTSLQYHPAEKNIIVRNDFRHLLKSGQYDLNVEVANNNVNPVAATDQNINTKNSQSKRYMVKSVGEFKVNKNSDFDYSIYHVGDKDYLRDYYNDFYDHTVSTANIDYIKDRSYFGAKTIAIQELGIGKDTTTQPLALPILTAYKETKPGIINERYSLLTNSTMISRENGLQYRRVSAKPEVTIPYNLKGNLFEASAAVQTDLYNFENNFNQYSVEDNNYDQFVSNYRPEAALSWSLPVANKFNKSTLVIEPMANYIISSYKNNFNRIADEDTNNNELTQNNLFLKDRFFGFDRNEAGRRYSYGVKSSLFNTLGQFTLGLGQSIRQSYRAQDISLRGFNDNNKSNIVGEFFYRSKKHFDITYNFHLNESDYNNELNEVIAILNFDRFALDTRYLLLKQTISNPIKREQITSTASFKVTNRLVGEFATTRDLITDREIVRRYGLTYNGCCITYGFSVSETHPTNFARPQISYNFILSIKNL